jgi:hypothetical protein
VTTRRALLMVGESTCILLHCENGAKPSWTSTVYMQHTSTQAEDKISDDQLRKLLASILGDAGGYNGRFCHESQIVQLEIKEASEIIVRFIQMVHLLTGEELAAEWWNICVELQRPWWVLQLLCEAARSGAVTSAVSEGCCAHDSKLKYRR